MRSTSAIFGATLADPDPDGETREAIRRKAPAVTITIETPRDRRRHIVLTEALGARLRRVVKGQDAALERVATTVATQLAKTSPTRPGTVLLLGATGTGKTTTIEALPTALDALGHRGTHVHRVDCGELASSHQIARLLGAPPGYVGHDEETPFGAALGSNRPHPPARRGRQGAPVDHRVRTRGPARSWPALISDRR